MGDGMGVPAAGGGGPFGSYATKKHPSWKKADRDFQKNSLIKMYYGTEKARKGKNELVKKKTTLKEALQTIRFKYGNYKKDPMPEVKVLDTEYPGKAGQKTYGQRKDVLGWNVNQFENKEEAKTSIDEIDSFARLIGASKKEKYERIKMFFPEQAKYLRRYIQEHIKGLRVKENGLWRRATIEEIKKLDNDSF
jgi:hypothetical protein